MKLLGIDTIFGLLSLMHIVRGNIQINPYIAPVPIQAPSVASPQVISQATALLRLLGLNNGSNSFLPPQATFQGPVPYSPSYLGYPNKFNTFFPGALPSLNWANIQQPQGPVAGPDVQLGTGGAWTEQLKNTFGTQAQISPEQLEKLQNFIAAQSQFSMQGPAAPYPAPFGQGINPQSQFGPIPFQHQFGPVPANQFGQPNAWPQSQNFPYDQFGQSELFQQNLLNIQPSQPQNFLVPPQPQPQPQPQPLSPNFLIPSQPQDLFFQPQPQPVLIQPQPQPQPQPVAAPTGGSADHAKGIYGIYPLNYGTNYVSPFYGTAPVYHGAIGKPETIQPTLATGQNFIAKPCVASPMFNSLRAAGKQIALDCALPNKKKQKNSNK